MHIIMLEMLLAVVELLPLLLLLFVVMGRMTQFVAVVYYTYSDVSLILILVLYEKCYSFF